MTQFTNLYVQPNCLYLEMTFSVNKKINNSRVACRSWLELARNLVVLCKLFEINMCLKSPIPVNI